MLKKRILLVDDDVTFSSMLSTYLNQNDFEVDTAPTSKKAVQLFQSKKFDVALVDFKLPDLDGLELIKLLKKDSHEIPVIFVTSYSDVRTAVTSIKLGAYEFVTKPVIPDELLLTIHGALKVKNKEKQSDKEHHKATDYVVGKDTSSRAVWEYIQLVAPTKMTVLLLGESGTGKEYAARMVHKYSKRSHKPFVALDCGVLSKELAASELFGHVKGAFTGASQDKKGSFEQAQGGTIFLDEVGNLPHEVQVQFLRAIQERSIRRLGSDRDIPVDVRIIAATNEHLKEAVEKGNFREDLYHRLNEFEILIPPLRERKADIDEYIKLFLHQAGEELDKNIDSVSDEVRNVIEQYNWPGNLRELKNVIKRGVLLSKGNCITIDQLPHELKNVSFSDTSSTQADATDLKVIQKEKEKELIIKLLHETNFNKSKTAKLLNIDRKTLYMKIAKHDIKA